MFSDHRIQQHQQRPGTSGSPHCAGFSLVELMVTLAVAGILTALAAPGLSGMIAGQRARGVATDLYTSLIKARSEALKRNASVTLSPVTADTWEDGWKVLFTDDDGNTTTLDDHNAVRNVTVTGPSSIIYRSSGRISGSSESTFDISTSGVTTHWCLSIHLSGRPYTTKKDSSC